MIAYIVRFKGRLLNHWDDIRNSYWFLPSVMALGSVILSYVTLLIDRHTIVEETFGKDWTYTGSAEGARSVLAIIASSMIGIAGVVFSITTVTLTLASSQFGPRILRNFMSDKPNQIVLGTFTATFLYCLLILRQTHGTDEDVGYEMFIPQLSMTVAVVFAIASLGVLIYFIHHVAASIQTPNVVAGIGQEFGRVVEDLYPDEVDEGHPPRSTPGFEGRVARPISGRVHGVAGNFGRLPAAGRTEQHSGLRRAARFGHSSGTRAGGVRLGRRCPDASLAGRPVRRRRPGRLLARRSSPAISGRRPRTCGSRSAN